MTTLLAVDPGWRHAAVAIGDPKTNVGLYQYDEKDPSPTSLFRFFEMLRLPVVDAACIESVGCRTGQGLRSTQLFGVGYGVCHAMLAPTVSPRPVSVVDPRTWQGYMLMQHGHLYHHGGKWTKDSSLRFAKDCDVEPPDEGDKWLRKHEHAADAYCMLVYLRSTLT